MKTLKVMCDYCASGLWLDGYMIDIFQLPKNVWFLKDRVKNWQDTYEQLMIPFLERDCNEPEDSYLKFKEFEESKPEFKSFIEEGRNIAIEFKKLLKMKILYFNETNSEYEEII